MSFFWCHYLYIFSGRYPSVPLPQGLFLCHFLRGFGKGGGGLTKFDCFFAKCNIAAYIVMYCKCLALKNKILFQFMVNLRLIN